MNRRQWIRSALGIGGMVTVTKGEDGQTITDSLQGELISWEGPMEMGKGLTGQLWAMATGITLAMPGSPGLQQAKGILLVVTKPDYIAYLVWGQDDEGAERHTLIAGVGMSGWLMIPKERLRRLVVQPLVIGKNGLEKDEGYERRWRNEG